MVLCEMLLVANNVTNRSSACFITGMEAAYVLAQKLLNFSTLPSMLLWLPMLAQ